MLLSAEAAKAAQKANMENSLETAQHALQDKQQVYTLFVPLGIFIYFVSVVLLILSFTFGRS